MLNRLSKLFMATGVAATVTTGVMIPRPASADTTSTLLTAAAAIGAIVLYSNIQRKQQANQIVGYTQNGGTVYADGRIVMPNGQTYYPDQNGQYAINQYGWNNGYNPQSYGYNTAPSPYYNNGYYNNTSRWQQQQAAAQRREQWQQQEAQRQQWQAQAAQRQQWQQQHQQQNQQWQQNRQNNERRDGHDNHDDHSRHH